MLMNQNSNLIEMLEVTFIIINSFLFVVKKEFGFGFTFYSLLFELLVLTFCLQLLYMHKQAKLQLTGVQLNQALHYIWFLSEILYKHYRRFGMNLMESANTYITSD